MLCFRTHPGTIERLYEMKYNNLKQLSKLKQEKKYYESINWDTSWISGVKKDITKMSNNIDISIQEYNEKGIYFDITKVIFDFINVNKIKQQTPQTGQMSWNI